MLGRSLYTAFLALALLFGLLWAQAVLTPPGVPPAGTPAPAGEVPARVRVLNGETCMDLALEDYLTGVVAAEMPADFEPEALRAQAVAARTYTLYCAYTGRHRDADVCTDYRCCQAWKSDAAMRESWGGAYADRLVRVRDAVRATAGQYLRYEAAPVFAAFHSSSPGFTEDCGAIWSSLPYLVSVPSPESAETVPNFISRVECSPLDFRDTLLSARPEADFTGEPADWIGALTRDRSGRVAELTLGGVPFTGVRLRELFALRSTAFALEYADGVFRFTVAGFGHGVGMSQYGANVMAAEGADCAAILAHYYPGTELVG